MCLRSIPAGFDPATVAAIDARLDAVEREEGVRILLAVESGSRAWGFPSPDSDYDCRFLYVRSREDYLSLWPNRDVIETPLEGGSDWQGRINEALRGTAGLAVEYYVPELRSAREIQQRGRQPKR